jgi:ATP-dependent Clp protease ATP-binding subunit ClpA
VLNRVITSIHLAVYSSVVINILGQVYVAESTVEETISILRGLKEKYEGHHGVRILDSALVVAAQLSSRYITGKLFVWV